MGGFGWAAGNASVTSTPAETSAEDIASKMHGGILTFWRARRND